MKQINSKILKAAFTCFVFMTFFCAKGQNFYYAKRMGGDSTDMVNRMTTDAAGNMYLTGWFDGISDFDPGPGTYTLAGMGGYTDAFVCKLSAAGSLLWAKQIGGAINREIGNAVAVDMAGNVYVAGFFWSSSTDFDPGPSTYTLSGPGIFVCKLSAAGNFVWARKMGGSALDEATSIALDPSANIYIGGGFENSSDFDPGAGTYPLYSAGLVDVFICKLDSSGSFMWAKQMGGTSWEALNSLAVDAGGNVYSAGSFQSNSVDFDPGASSYVLGSSTGGALTFISKLDNNGNFLFAKDFDCPSGSNYPTDITLNASGEIYLTGTFSGVTDFDPGVGTYTLNTPVINTSAAYISKLGNAGNFIWAGQFDGYANSISLDAPGNLYATGYFQGTAADMDPGPGMYTLASSGNSDVFVSKLSPSGTLSWAVAMGGATAADEGKDIAVDSIGNVYTVGEFYAAADFDPGAGIYPLISAGKQDIFISKLCPPPSNPSNTTASQNLFICSGQTTTLSATATGTVNWYATATSTAAIASGTNYATPALTAGTYTYFAEAVNYCSTSSGRTPITVTVNALPVLSISGSNTVCLGSTVNETVNGASTYTWSTGSNLNMVSVTPSVNTTYTVNGTDVNGCVNTVSKTISVTPLPAVAISGGSVTCSGSPVNLMASGANTYTWSTGSTSNAVTVSPTVTTTYSVTGTSTLGCNNTSSKMVTVNPLPAVSIATSNTLICAGQSATLTASGASSYTWNTSSSSMNIVVSPTANTTYMVNGTDMNGCMNGTAFTQSVSACTGIVSLKSTGLKIYPNPVSSVLYIVPGNVSLRGELLVYNLLGSVICRTAVTGAARIEVDFSEQVNGVYFVKYSTEDGTFIQKLIKE